MIDQSVNLPTSRCDGSSVGALCDTIVDRRLRCVSVPNALQVDLRFGREDKDGALLSPDIPSRFHRALTGPPLVWDALHASFDNRDQRADTSNDHCLLLGDKQSLVWLACTCQTLEGQALSTLWSERSSLATLIEGTLPPAVFPPQTHADVTRLKWMYLPGKRQEVHYW